MVDVLYLDLMRDILENGKRKNDRTGTGTVSVFGRGFRMNMKEGFPLLTTKKVYWNGVVSELLWFLRGDSNIKYLNDHNVHIWDDWQDWNGKNDGEMGRIYSKQWREFRGWKEVENGEIEVYNLSGERINDYSFSSSTGQISFLFSGTYIAVRHTKDKNLKTCEYAK